MREEFPLLYFLMMFVFVTSPFTFLVGLFLLFDINTYQKIEKFLGKSFGVSRTKGGGKWVGLLDKNRESLQLFLLERRGLLGIICLLQSMLVFMMNILWLIRS